MIKRFLVVLLVAVSVGACAPGMHRPLSPQAPCVSTLATSTFNDRCNAARYAFSQEQQQSPKDFSTWAILLGMGFTALYLIAFK